MKNSKLWMNRETGELLTYEEAWNQGAEWYNKISVCKGSEKNDGSPSRYVPG